MPAFCVALDIVIAFYWGSKQPIRWDTDETMAKALTAYFPKRGYEGGWLLKYVKRARKFFTVLPDGRLVPSPKYFLANDPYLDGAQ